MAVEIYLCVIPLQRHRRIMPVAPPERAGAAGIDVNLSRILPDTQYARDHVPARSTPHWAGPRP